MLPNYANRFDMPNFRAVRDAGTNFKQAYLGYMASETVIAHNVITSGLLPKHMGWVDEAYRDTENLLGFGAGEMHITGDLSLADFGTLISHEDYSKLADYLHGAYEEKFIVVGEKSYAVESAVAPTGDIGVHVGPIVRESMNDCRTLLGGRYRSPTGKNVPSYLLTGPLMYEPPVWALLDRSSDTPPMDYGTKDAFPSRIYFEDGNRFFLGTDASALAGTRAVIVGRRRRDRDDPERRVVGDVRDARRHRQGGHMGGAGRCPSGELLDGAGADPRVLCSGDRRPGVRPILDAVEALDAEDDGDTLVVLTADHGGTFGQSFYGRTEEGLSNSNWYYAPQGVGRGCLHGPHPACRAATARRRPASRATSTTSPRTRSILSSTWGTSSSPTSPRRSRRG